MIPNGYYYRLTESQLAILRAFVGNDPTLSSLLDDFQLFDDGYYYALCDEVDFAEQGAIVDAGLDLDMWIYVKSTQWIKAGD